MSMIDGWDGDARKVDWILTRRFLHRLGPEIANGDEDVERSAGYVYGDGDFIQIDDSMGTYVVTVGNESETFRDLAQAENWLWDRIESERNG